MMESHKIPWFQSPPSSYIIEQIYHQLTIHIYHPLTIHISSIYHPYIIIYPLIVSMGRNPLPVRSPSLESHLLQKFVLLLQGLLSLPRWAQARGPRKDMLET